jgi:hypothetical protein
VIWRFLIGESLVVNGDLDGNGQREATIDFPGSGIWVWQNFSAWWKLHNQSAESITTGDLDRSGRSDVVIDVAV